MAVTNGRKKKVAPKNKKGSLADKMNWGGKKKKK